MKLLGLRQVRDGRKVARTKQASRSRTRRLFLERLEERALLAVSSFTDQAAFLAVLPGTAQTVDFDSVAVFQGAGASHEPVQTRRRAPPGCRVTEEVVSSVT
jgi:hypothetical protein